MSQQPGVSWYGTARKVIEAGISTVKVSGALSQH